MENKVISTSKIQYSKVYLEDFYIIKKLFLESSYVDSSVGLPYLMVKKEDQPIALISLFINSKGKNDFKIQTCSSLSALDHTAIQEYAKASFIEESSDNFHCPNQLQASIDNLVHWLHP